MCLREKGRLELHQLYGSCRHKSRRHRRCSSAMLLLLLLRPAPTCTAFCPLYCTNLNHRRNSTSPSSADSPAGPKEGIKGASHGPQLACVAAHDTQELCPPSHSLSRSLSLSLYLSIYLSIYLHLSLSPSLPSPGFRDTPKLMTTPRMQRKINSREIWG